MPTIDLKSKGLELAIRLKRARCQRLGLAVNRTDDLIVAIFAAIECQKELLLVRGIKLPDCSTLCEWGVDSILQENGELVSIADPKQNADQAGIILLTSGTTGRPKAARHTMTSLRGRIREKQDGQPGSIRWLLTYHPASFAGLQVILTAMAGGSALISTTARDFNTLAASLIEHQPTHVSATPSFWRALVSAISGQLQSISLRHVTLGGETVEQGLLDDLKRLFPQAAIRHIYASTEAGAVFSVKDGLSGFPSRWLVEGVDGAQLRVVNGMLEVNTPRRMQAYVGDSLNSLTDDGWVQTKDLVDVQGQRVHFLGRSDSVINVGGMKVMPEEVESVLCSIEGVQDAYVYGAPNVVTGSIVCADIVLKTNEETVWLMSQIKQMAKMRLERHQLPAKWVQVAIIKTNTIGKKCRQEIIPNE